MTTSAGRPGAKNKVGCRLRDKYVVTPSTEDWRDLKISREDETGNRYRVTLAVESPREGRIRRARDLGHPARVASRRRLVQNGKRPRVHPRSSLRKPTTSTVYWSSI